MLPAQGSDIRGILCPRTELLTASGYSQRPKEFQRLLEILDAELRIITPAESPSAGESSDSAQPREEPAPDVAAAGPSYQLTHDYLVPALCEWLNRKRKGTRRGRAELLMEERAKEWGSTRQNRMLPSLRESLIIALFTGRRTRPPVAREMMRRAWRLQGLRLGGAVALLATVLALIVWVSFRPAIDVLEDARLPNETRLKALAKLNLKEPAVFERVMVLLMKDQGAGLVGGLLEALFRDAGQDAQEGGDAATA